jgi:hypothetical protein
VNRSRLAALSAGAMFLVASVLVPATALAAGTGTLSLSPSNPSTSTGSTFTVTINTQGSVPIEGASASLDFDKTRLEILSVAKPTLGTGWNVAGVSYVLPNAGAIAAANSSGHLVSIAAFFTDGTSNLPAATTEALATVTFFATATGTANISLPTTGSDPGGLLDGSAQPNYGTSVATTSTPASVDIATGTSTGSTSTTNVTGTVDAGFVALSCPTSITVPLIRNINNTTDFECAVGSNATWTLSVIDQNADPASHGYMVDPGPPAKHLHDPAFVRYNKHLDDLNNVVYDTNVNLSTNASAQAVANGQNNISAPLTFTQFAEPQDTAGNYSMSLRFTIATTF